ncbi:MAG: helix-turn-helix transcriptional regulator [Symploca sp. SIO1B1]|nr:helix-turn-helix transcriptional regulator [Symploca sp. SIO1C2]NER99444.1 helix-turn-helix transcriptional regulator [Symploca sp. SIO1B1]
MRIRLIKEIEVNNLGQRIKQARLDSDKSLEQICQEVKMSRTYWYDIEKETLKGALSLENLRKIEEVLGIDFGVKLKFEGEQSEEEAVGND